MANLLRFGHEKLSNLSNSQYLRIMNWQVNVKKINHVLSLLNMAQNNKQFFWQILEKILNSETTASPDGIILKTKALF